MSLPKPPAPIRLSSGGHCCACSVICHHIGPPSYCSAHGGFRPQTAPAPVVVPVPYEPATSDQWRAAYDQKVQEFAAETRRASAATSRAEQAEAALAEAQATVAELLSSRDAWQRKHSQAVAEAGAILRERDAALAALAEVRKLHQPGDFPDCRACGDPHPCPTVKLLDCTACEGSGTCSVCRGGSVNEAGLSCSACEDTHRCSACGGSQLPAEGGKELDEEPKRRRCPDAYAEPGGCTTEWRYTPGGAWHHCEDVRATPHPQHVCRCGTTIASPIFVPPVSSGTGEQSRPAFDYDDPPCGVCGCMRHSCAADCDCCPEHAAGEQPQEEA